MKNQIPQKEFDFIDKVDKEYIELFKKNFLACKKNLPHFAKFNGYKMTEDKKYFNGRLVGGGMKPRYITEKMEEHTKKRIEIYFKVMHRLRDLFRTSKKLQTYFNLSKEEIKLVKTDHGFDSIVPFSRFDSILNSEDGLRVYELNTNCAATPGWVEMLVRVLTEFPFWDDFKRKYNINYYDYWAEKVLQGIIKNYKEWGGKQTKPDILILRWPGQYNHDSDFLCQEFQKLGHHAMVGDVTQVYYKNKKLFYSGTQYDLVLRWFDLGHLLYEVKPMYQDLLKAFYDNAVCIINPLSSSVFAHKSLFAFFTDEQFDEYITKEERKILGNMCPWTRIIEKRKTTAMDGSIVDLYNYIIDNQNKLLIKPTIGTYGVNVFIGKKLSKAQWKRVLSTAMREGSWVVQEYITIPRHFEPFVMGNKVIRKEINHDFGPYMINERYSGGMARCSHNLITNLMQDGCFQIVGSINSK